MAKHPHLLQLINHKTWRCMLEGCAFFVHTGLAHILIGKTIVCWNCEDKFIASELALEEEKPRCDDCRIGMSSDVIEQLLKKKMEGEDNE